MDENLEKTALSARSILSSIAGIYERIPTETLRSLKAAGESVAAGFGAGIGASKITKHGIQGIAKMLASRHPEVKKFKQLVNRYMKESVRPGANYKEVLPKLIDAKRKLVGMKKLVGEYYLSKLKALPAIAGTATGLATAIASYPRIRAGTVLMRDIRKAQKLRNLLYGAGAVGGLGAAYYALRDPSATSKISALLEIADNNLTKTGQYGYGNERMPLIGRALLGAGIGGAGGYFGGPYLGPALAGTVSRVRHPILSRIPIISSRIRGRTAGVLSRLGARYGLPAGAVLGALVGAL